MDVLSGPLQPEAALVDEISRSQARALRRMNYLVAVPVVLAVGGLVARGLGLTGLARGALFCAALATVPFILWRLSRARVRLWVASGPPLPPVRPALDDGEDLVFDASLERALFHEPGQIVWAYAKRRGGLLPFVVVGLASGVRYAIVLDALGCRRVLDVLARVAIGAEVGFSAEREARYLHNPRVPPRLQTRPQIVGAKCPACATKMVTEQGALLCERCGRPVHDACLGAHLRAAHRDATDHVYR